jgi:UPF0755 protein
MDQNKTKTLMWGLFIALFISLSVFSISFLLGGKREVVDVLIPRGKSLGQVSEILKQKEIISHPTLLKIFLKVTGGSSKVKAGEFRFHKPMSTIGALVVLYYSDPVTHPVTIPEGYNLKQIAGALAEQKLVDEKKFLSIALSKKTAEKYHLNAPHMEGFLYPDTYDFSLIDGEEKIIERMYQKLLTLYEKEFKAEAQQKNFTFEKLMTLASIVEKETGDPSERSLVSSVFHNRLKKHMRLQSDPTTIYGIKNYDGNIHKKDLLTHTPYNTYTIPALPPGPIASPGAEAIRATLRPAESDYLYFVAKTPGGSHIFSKTYEQHSRHVNSYQVEPVKRKISNTKHPQKKKKR